MKNMNIFSIKQNASKMKEGNPLGPKPQSRVPNCVLNIEIKLKNVMSQDVSIF